MVVDPFGTAVYVTAIDENAVFVIDPETLMVIATIPVGADPLGISVLPNGRLLYVVNRDDHAVSVIDTQIQQVIDTIPVGLNPIGHGQFIGPVPPP